MQGELVKGERVDIASLTELTLGQYARHKGTWYACCPNGLIANLGRHTVTPHEDGSITVSPSILCTGANDSGDIRWHGMLEKGIWKDMG
jgi:hypothetical protein